MIGQSFKELQHVGTKDILGTAKGDQPQARHPCHPDGMFFPLQSPPQLGQGIDFSGSKDGWGTTWSGLVRACLHRLLGHG
jgi:hypothetical protein